MNHLKKRIKLKLNLLNMLYT